MSSQPFAFPPPPPAPLITSQTSPSYAPSHAGYDGYRGVYGGRGDRGERGSRFNRGHGRASSRGGSFGSSYSTSYNRFPLGGDGRYSLPPHVGHEAQAVERDGYPLPNYSPVPLPQHPPNLREEHRYQASAVPASTANVRPPQARYPPYMQGHTVNLNGQHQYAPNCYGLSAHNIQNIAPPALQNTNAPPAHAHADQPVLMGPPIRMGFDGQQKGFQNHLQSLSTATGTNAHKRGRPNSNDSPYRHESPMDSSATRNSPQAILPGHRGRGQKRGHRVAFSKPRYQNARTHVAPAVPSFGGPLPLPVKPPPPQENVPRPRKKRKNNQLGLTPKAEEHESSEEDAEDDADEESKLAATVGSSQGFQLLQFDYKGRTSTLQTSSDIAAWIKERKKRFPTKARAAEIAEAGRKCEYLHRAAPQARKDTVEKEWSNARVTQSEKTGTENSVDEERDRAIDAAAKAKRKVEKLRKQLEKEEKRVAKAEAKVSKDGATDDVREAKKEASAQGNFDRIRKRSEREECGNTKVEDASFGKLDLQKISIGAAINGDTVFQSKDELSEASFDELAHTFTPENSQQSMVAVPDPLTTTSQPPAPDEDLDPAAALHSGGTPSQMRLSTEPVSRRSDALTTASLDPSSPNSSIACSSAGISSTVSENDTSSSCSSSETASENVAPDSASSKRNGPEKVAPPKRRKPNQRQKQICREFLKNGRCRRGENCVYRHELPERGSRNVGIKEPSMLAGKKERVGLYQRLVEQEKEKEDHEVLSAIIHLGEQGLLDENLHTGNGQ